MTAWYGTELERVFNDGPDFPLWINFDASEPRILSLDQCEFREGALYLTRVEEEVYGVLWRTYLKPKLAILKYDRSAHTLAQERGAPFEVASKTNMRTAMENLPSYLVRWALEDR